MTPPGARASLLTRRRRGSALGSKAGGARSRSPSQATEHNGSWISRNASQPSNASGAETAGVFIGSLLRNFTVLWSTCRTTVFKSVTNTFIKNLACSGICASLVCVPFDIVLSTMFCSVTILSFPAIAMDRYYSVLYPLERKISDAKSRELVMYIWAHAVVASIPVFAVTNVADIYATSTCTEVWSNSLGHLVYVLLYNIITVIVPVAVVFLFLILI
ncbi:putative G-protein coupled receptor 176 [Plecturocebus cupreus]